MGRKASPQLAPTILQNFRASGWATVLELAFLQKPRPENPYLNLPLSESDRGRLQVRIPRTSFDHVRSRSDLIRYNSGLPDPT